jgi:hypothetical protein
MSSSLKNCVKCKERIARYPCPFCKYKPFNLTEKELIEKGDFVRNVENDVVVDKLNDKVDVVIKVVDRHTAELEQLQEKFDARVGLLHAKLDAMNEKFKRLEGIVLKIEKGASLRQHIKQRMVRWLSK